MRERGSSGLRREGEMRMRWVGVGVRREEGGSGWVW